MDSRVCKPGTEMPATARMIEWRMKWVNTVLRFIVPVPVSDLNHRL